MVLAGNNAVRGEAPLKRCFRRGKGSGRREGKGGKRIMFSPFLRIVGVSWRSGGRIGGHLLGRLAGLTRRDLTRKPNTRRPTTDVARVQWYVYPPFRMSNARYGDCSPLPVYRRRFRFVSSFGTGGRRRGLQFGSVGWGGEGRPGLFPSGGGPRPWVS